MADFRKVAAINEIQPGTKKVFEIDGIMVALFNVNGEYYAIEDICSHDGGALVEGELHGYEITCPRHSARFDIRTGKPLCMPAITSIRHFPVKTENDFLWIDLD